MPHFYLDQNIAINVDLFLYGNGARTQGEVKINATASVINLDKYKKKSVTYIGSCVNVNKLTNAELTLNERTNDK